MRAASLSQRRAARRLQPFPRRVAAPCGCGVRRVPAPGDAFPGSCAWSKRARGSGTAADTIETVVPKHLDRLPRSRWVAALERAGAGYVA